MYNLHFHPDPGTPTSILLVGSDQTFWYLSTEARSHCTKQAFELLPLKSAPPNSYHATFQQETHREDKNRDAKTGKGETVLRVNEQAADLHCREENMCVTPSIVRLNRGHRTATTSASSHFQAPWQKEQQYQKVRNSFLRDRPGGALRSWWRW